MWDALFAATNLVAVAGWIALLAGARREPVFAAVLHAAVGLLCLTYLALFVVLFGDLVDPARVAGAAEPDISDYSIAGIRALFQSDGGIVLGWTHYLAFDLFAGLWIAREAAAARLGRLATAPFLVATFLAGPIGVLSWLAMRRRYA